MISRGTRLSIAIGVTALSLTLNAAAILSGLGDMTYQRLLTFYGDWDAQHKSLRPAGTRYAAGNSCLDFQNMNL